MAQTDGDTAHHLSHDSATLTTEEWQTEVKVDYKELSY